MKIYTSVEYNELLQQGLKSGEFSHHSDGINSIFKSRHPLFKGYVRQVELRSGLALKIIDFHLQSSENLGIALQHDQDQPLTLAFQLTGHCRVLTEGIKDDYYCEKAGESYLFFVPGTKEIEEYPAKIQIKSVRIRISPELLQQFWVKQSHSLPQELKNLLETDAPQIFHRRVGAITSSMQLALQQILHCSHQGISQRLYLESKVLELIALQLSQLYENNNNSKPTGYLRSPDVDSIYKAKEILIRNVENPPSLLELSRQVGLNDYKLKRGFRQIFNTTVYGYLQIHRMEQAKQLLSDQVLSIAGVARKVGYSSQSRFCDAFKRHVGMTPRDYKASQRL